MGLIFHLARKLAKIMYLVVQIMHFDPATYHRNGWYPLLGVLACSLWREEGEYDASKYLQHLWSSLGAGSQPIYGEPGEEPSSLLLAESRAKHSLIIITNNH